MPSDRPAQRGKRLDRPAGATQYAALCERGLRPGRDRNLAATGCGVSLVANDGTYLRPYLIESVRQSSRIVRQLSPARLRQTLAPETARRIKGILERVVTEGTGVLAQIDGVSVCGKTGTAQKVEPGGGYSKTKSRMTFIGFFPKDRPKYVIAVLIDEPKTERFAGTAACPVFKQMART